MHCASYAVTDVILHDGASVLARSLLDGEELGVRTRDLAFEQALVAAREIRV